MIMTLDLERHSESIPDVHKTGILFPGFDQKPPAATRKLFQFSNGIFVAAVFAPHDTEYAKFGIIWIPAQNSPNTIKLFFTQTVFHRNLRCYFLVDNVHAVYSVVSIVNRSCSFSTVAPFFASTLTIFPFRVALSSFSIFMASRLRRLSPAWT